MTVTCWSYNAKTNHSHVLNLVHSDKQLGEGGQVNSERSKSCPHWVLLLDCKEGPSFENVVLTPYNFLKHWLIQHFVLCQDSFDFSGEKWDIFQFQKFRWHSLQVHYSEGWTQEAVDEHTVGLAEEWLTWKYSSRRCRSGFGIWWKRMNSRTRNICVW